LVAVENILYLSVDLSRAGRFRASAGHGVSAPSKPSLIVSAIPPRRIVIASPSVSEPGFDPDPAG